ncbi:MAG TPA: hypothetical protein DIU30_06620 [Clostridiales bacterium]|jgi:putative uncharacterized protein (fragment)|nr:hypothetical protein [Clostridium sp.]MEE1379211.1 hypothetical protein [Clostridia bacterium]CDE54001.1 sH3 domain protein [Clostridium sp. CAG:269]HCQ55993.1 hypothetical protein [Clostridiales bacterium]
MKKNHAKFRYFKVVLALLLLLSTFPFLIGNAAYNNCCGLAKAVFDNLPVYDSSIQSEGNIKDYIFPNETFTILCKDGNSYFISYSTANGPTLGYVFTGFMFDTYSTCMGIVTSYSSVYYGPDTTTYERSGSVNSGEYVAILASESNWYFIEYDTSNGRKRAYVPAQNVSIQYAEDSNIPLFGNVCGELTISSKINVRQGPSTLYSVYGSVSNQKADLLKVEDDFYYIRYSLNSGKLKTGYIAISDYNAQ